MSNAVEMLQSLCATIFAFTQTQYWQTLKDFFNSNFITAVCGSLAGAYFGATAAQKIAENSKTKDDLAKEIRVTNTSIMLSVNICESVIGLKRQHFKVLKHQYDEERGRVLMEQQETNRTLIECSANLSSLPCLLLPFTVLRPLIFEQLTLHGRPIAMLNGLEQSADSLNVSLANRNSLIEKFKSDPPVDPLFVAKYFGIPMQNRTYNEYFDIMNSIEGQIDDSIFFGMQLYNALNEHGNTLKTRFEKSFGKSHFNIISADFSHLVSEGVIPNDDNYRQWFDNFGKA
ncbi:hypothetical protein [Methylocella silvestris]|uniref:hypothetical protein n=1 Tax=Methylocella silvestris TaxID=199596 RepID=UPI0011AF3AD4|nr:hypothetical protein [Methylocella silvestris]